MVHLEVEIDVHVLSKSGGVVVSVCPRVAECLQDVVGLQQHVFGTLDLGLAGHVCHGSDVPLQKIIIIKIVFRIRFKDYKNQ